MPRLSNAKWAAARKMWEDGGSMSAVAKKFGVSVSTVKDHRDREGWERHDPEPGPSLPEQVIDQFAPEQRADISEDDRVAYLQRIAELERDLDAARQASGDTEKESAKFLYTTADEVIAFIGPDKMRDRALMGLAKINRERARMGLEPYRDEGHIEAEIRKIAEELVERRTRAANETQLRTVKLLFRGRLVAYPVEPQFNNEVAAPGSSLWKMRDKGAKICMPYLCQRQNCWLPATVDASGNFKNNGYCGELHESTDVYLLADRRRPAGQRVGATAAGSLVRGGV